MRDGHGPTRIDLPGEQRDGRAGAPDHVAEPHDHESRPAARSRHRLHDHLGDALARAHDVRRTNGLVGRHEHKGAHRAFRRRTRHIHGTQHIVAHSLDDVVLDDRNMLVGRRVIDRFHREIVDDHAHAHIILNRAQQRHDARMESAAHGELLQFAIDRIECIFTAIDQQQLPRRLGQDLPAKFRADGTPGTGDHDRLPGNAACHELGARRHRHPPQQILQGYLLHLGDGGAAAHQVLERWDGTHLHRVFGQGVDDFPAPRITQRGHGKKHFGDCMALQLHRQFTRRNDRNIVYHLAVQPGIVIDEKYRVALFATLQRREQLATGGARTVDGDARQVAPHVMPVPRTQRES